MKKVTIKGVDGKEIEAYFCSDHPNNFPTDMAGHKVEEVGLNKHYVAGNIFDDPNKLIEEGKADWMSGNEQDVNENSAGNVYSVLMGLKKSIEQLKNQQGNNPQNN